MQISETSKNRTLHTKEEMKTFTCMQPHRACIGGNLPSKCEVISMPDAGFLIRVDIVRLIEVCYYDTRDLHISPF